MDMGLKDKVAWVTGATSAIGREIALAFAREGAKIAISARSESALEKLADEIEQVGSVALAISVDVTDAEGVGNAAEQVVAQMGRIDVLATTRARPD